MVDRLDKDDRKELILNAAHRVALANNSYRLIKRDDVAIEAGVSIGLVTHYFGDISKLQEAVVKRGVSKGNKKIILQALLTGHPSVKNMTMTEKVKLVRNALGRD